MTPFTPSLLVASALTILGAGLIPLVTPIPPRVAGRLAAFITISASVVGLVASLLLLISRTTLSWTLSWGYFFGPATIGIDPLTSLFTIPVFLIGGLSSLYGIGYMPTEEDPGRRRPLLLFIAIMVASMIFVTMARSAGLFLLSWELMAIAAFLALSIDHRDPPVRQAGTIYLICTHTGTLLIFLTFALLRGATGSFLIPAPHSLDGSTITASLIVIAAVLGFGFKAGFIPLHIWLPSAHANAPSHVSALMSGVLLKIGIYGMLRFLTLFHTPPLWWGILILVLGIVSGIVGVLFAIGQHDIKRLLAYHSIENIGIIMTGIGLFVAGNAVGSPLIATLGVGGALLHTLNHATFKALLFYGAGSVIHATGTRDIDRMGGLLPHLPLTAATFLTGAVAICGLPPLNGFVSELLIYLGFFRGVVEHPPPLSVTTAIAAPSLALIGGLAVACFVKVFGTVFLGSPRTPREHLHESPRTMGIPLVTLSLVCFSIGTLPFLLPPLLDPVITQVSLQVTPLASSAPLPLISSIAIALILLLLILGGTFRLSMGKKPAASGPTWGCGYLAPTPRMQYTASSFAQMLVLFFAGILRPSTHTPHIRGVMPKAARFGSHVPEAVLELVVEPFIRRQYERTMPIRRLQSGLLQQYVLYILITIMAIFVIGFF